jgi:four helix bundle protein
MRDYKKIKVWQKSYKLVLDIYRMTESFPKQEIYALTSQIRRAAVSIPSNIAEGSAKDSEPDFARFLEISLGSAFELECQLLLARDLSYIQLENSQNLMQDVEEVKKMLFAFIKTLRK